MMVTENRGDVVFSPNLSVLQTQPANNFRSDRPWAAPNFASTHLTCDSSTIMCQVTRNRFSCTKHDTIHLLVDHSYPSSVCDKRDKALDNLKRYCHNAVFFDKVFDYQCELCASSTNSERKKWRQEYYDKTKERLENPGPA